MTAVFKYPGSKWNIAKWIISYFPEHHSYLEPFFGSGAVLFTKERSNIETVNDINGEIMNLFRWIRNDPERLAREIYWIPYARSAYEQALREQESETDDFRRAVNLYTRMMMAYGFRADNRKNGWRNDIQGREKAYAALQWRDAPQKIFEAAERLRGVQIENRPAIEVIQRFNYPNVLIYADPPYLFSTRSGGKQYSHEMTDDEHLELLLTLKQHSGPVVLSGYANDLYRTELQGWTELKTANNDQLGRKREETLWLNFVPSGQMKMF